CPASTGACQKHGRISRESEHPVHRIHRGEPSLTRSSPPPSKDFRISSPICRMIAQNVGFAPVLLSSSSVAPSFASVAAQPARPQASRRSHAPVAAASVALSLSQCWKRLAPSARMSTNVPHCAVCDLCIDEKCRLWHPSQHSGRLAGGNEPPPPGVTRPAPASAAAPNWPKKLLEELDSLFSSAGTEPIVFNPTRVPIAIAFLNETSIDDKLTASPSLSFASESSSSAVPLLHYRRLTTSAPSIMAGRHPYEFLVVQPSTRVTTLPVNSPELDTELALGLPEGFDDSLSLLLKLGRSRVVLHAASIDCAFRERLRLSITVCRRPWCIQAANPLLVIRLVPIANYVSYAERTRVNCDDEVAML
ncbi:MAG: hypothetical protein BJ554DRAFT_7662, partial [Olpidium bornovanus]